MTPAAAKYALGDFVEKIRGSKWRGKVVGFYETENTPIGYVVKSWFETGSVQDWPEAALGPWTPPTATAAEEALEKAREALEEVAMHLRFQEGHWPHRARERAREALAAIDAAKAKGGG